MTRALITGASGFVGSHLAEYLIDNTDWDVYGMLRWNEPADNLQSLIPLANRKERMAFSYGDLRDSWSMSDVVRVVRPDYVFHLGAQSYPQTSFGAANDTLETNIQGTVNLLEAVKQHARGAWVHVCSSSEVYGRAKKEHLPITEDCPFSPASPYSVSKAAADMMGRLYADAYGMRILVTRMFTHTGARRGDVFAESSFAKQIAMIEAGQIEPVIRVGNLNSLRTIADVRDAVRAYHMLLTVNPQPGEVYNIGGSHSCTVGEILNALLRLSGVKAEVVVDPARIRPVDADLQVPDCGKFIRHTGWVPSIPFEETMQSLLDHWRAMVRKGAYLIR